MGNRVLSDQDVKKLFGEFPYARIDGSSHIDIDRSWLQKNIQPIFIPQLKGVETYGGHLGGNIPCHVLIHWQLARCFEDIEAAGLLSKIIFWGGSFVPRMIRGSHDRISRHAWGIAIDINPQHNQLGQPPALPGDKGSVRELVPIFDRWGFTWGGRWPVPDGMHFEACRITN